MKKLLAILFSFVLIQSLLAQKNCCPEFELVADMEPCMPPKTGNPTGNDHDDFPHNPVRKDTLGACKNTTHSYYIIPNKLGYTYTWAVTGGTAVSTTGNPMKITWGNGATGLIEVYIASNDGLCTDTISSVVLLMNSPTAAFNFTPASPVCFNQNIAFNNTSVGAAAYYWDFGDGTTSTQTNPNHTYTTAGTYTVTMVAYSEAPSPKPAQGQLKPCGCRDTIQQTIVVKPESGLTIEPGCKQMLCKGDTATYCTPNSCSSLNWSVTGGTIISSATGKCIKVVWNGNYPATVTLNGNCGGTCGNTTTITAPVLYPAMTPTGSNKVCINSTTNYSLPVMPGTFYNWTVTGANTIIGPNQNTADINIQWSNTPGTYTVECTYKNPHTGCDGKATMTVDVVVPFKISGPKIFCKNQPFSFSANGNATWSISPSSGYTPSTFAAGTSISGTWNTAGTYTITATTTTPGSFCTLTDQLEVVVNDIPVVNPITGPVCICPGGNGLYQVTSNMNDGYFIWNITGGYVSSYSGPQNNQAMITWYNTGTYGIQVTQVVNGCQSAPVNLTVNACPAPTFTGFLSTCMDEEVTYTSPTPAPVGGYNWTLSNGLGTITHGQGTNSIKILWHGATTVNTCVITLEVCGQTYSQTVTINNPPPLTITKAGSFCATTGATLTASISGAVSYQWSLDNVPLGPPQNTQTISITQAGVYTLIVDNGGCKSKASIIVPVEKLNLTATLSTKDKTVWGCTETVNTLLHAAPASSAYCYQWYGSSSLNGPYGPISGSGATTPNYLVTSPGYYYCTISICNTACKEYTDTIRVSKIPCDSCTGITNYTVNFTNTPCNPISFTASTNPPAALGWVHWYFGDGHEGNGINITHQYKDTGVYKVCAEFSNTGYCPKYICKDVDVSIAANFSATANCDKVTVTNLSKSRNPIISYNWSFPGASPASSSLANPPAVTYASGGLHTITLTISDGTCTVSYQDTIRTYNATATMNVPTPLCAKTYAPFTATSSTPGLNYNWNFGDGFISNLQNVTHAYQNAGNYTVTLTVTSATGCTNTYTQNVTVDPAPVVNIGNNIQICPGTSTNLTAPGGYGSYQWFYNGVPISGTTGSTYAASQIGEYWVQVANGTGCVALSNHITIGFLNAPIAKIVGKKIVCTNNIPFNVYNNVNYSGYNYQWNITGPTAGSFSAPTASFTTVNIPSPTPGNYEITLVVTDNYTGCRSYDTLCVFVDKSPTITVTAPNGTLCEGKTHTFIASATPSITPQEYIFSWSNGFIGDTLVTGMPGAISVSAFTPNGCPASAFAGTINPRPNVSLFPLGCDTLCLTDTIFFPLPTPVPSSYNVNWYDDDGTAVTSVGTGLSLPLAGLHPGIHHFYAVVSYSGGCADTTGKYNLYVKDCNLPVPCDVCTDLVDAASAQPIKVATGTHSTIINYNLSFTIKKPVKEVRISVADLKYSWNDPNCKNCKVPVLERGCLFPDAGNTNLGSLVWDDYTGSGHLSAASANNCPEELVWKNGTPMQPGTYTVPVQLSLPKPLSKDCKLKLDKICFHLTLIDTLCRSCDKIICATDTMPNEEDCKCNGAKSWTNLTLLQQQSAAPNPASPILCNTTITGIVANTPYSLSGMYYCEGNCVSSNNEIIVYDQNNQIIYTRVATTLNEALSFPATGLYTIILTASCGTKKCVCNFKVQVGGGSSQPPGGGVPPGGNPPVGFPPSGNPPAEPPVEMPLPPDLPVKIDSIVKQTIPPDFNGGVLVSKNDSTLFEKYYSYKDNVNNHTPFDIASITKTFTATGILKLMEDGKLNIDDPVQKYLPKFPYTDITIRMLLSHRSGLEDYLHFIDGVGWDRNRTVQNKDLLNIIADNKSKIQIRKPGEAYDYSNTNYALLGLIIEAVSGTSYSQYLNSQFFMPLKMDDTYVLNIDNFAKSTKSYYRNGTTYKLRYLDLIYGDKCIYSTPQDLKKWDNALRTGKLLNKSTLELAYKTIGNPASFSSSYAIGWKKVIASNGKAFYYHDGWWGGSRALLIRLVDENVVIAVLSNNNYTKIKDIKKLVDLFGDYGISSKKVSNF